MNELELKVRLSAVDRLTATFNNIKGSARSVTQQLKATKEALQGLKDQQKLIDKYKNTNKAIGINAQDLEKARVRVKALSDQINATASPTAAMQKEFKAAALEARNLASQSTVLRTKKQHLRQELSTVGIDTKKLATHQRDLNSRMLETTAQVKKQTDALAVQNQRMKELHATQAQYRKTMEIRDKALNVGVSLGAAGTATGAPILSAVTQYSGFQDDMRGVARQFEAARDESGKLTQSYYELGDAFKTMSEQIPMAAGELAKIGEGGARQGIQEQKALVESTRLSANMATAFDMPVDEIGKDMGQIVNLLHEKISNLEAIGDVINYLDDNAMSEGRNIIGVMKRTAGVTDGRMDYRQSAALASTMLSLGATEETAATAINSIITNLSNAKIQGPKFQNALRRLDLNAKAISDGMANNTQETLLLIMDKVNALPKNERLEITTQLFGKEFGDDFAKISSNAGEYKRQIGLAHDDRARGSMQREADINNSTLSAEWIKTKNAFNNLQIDAGALMEDELKETLVTVRGLLQGFRAWVKENPRLAGALMTTVKWVSVMLIGLGGLALGIAAVLGPFAMAKMAITTLGIQGFGAIGLLVKSVAIAKFAFMGLIRVLLFNPIGLIVTAIAAGAYFVYRNWDMLKGLFSSLWESIKSSFDGGLAGILATIANWSPFAAIYNVIQPILSLFGIELPQKFSDAGGMLMEGLINGIKNKMGAVKDTVLSMSNSVVEWFKKRMDIRSPSRVFAELGGWTMAGLAQGLTAGGDGPLAALSDIAKKLTALGAGIVFSGAAAAIPLDTRPAIQASGSSAGAATSITYQYNITIHAPAGSDNTALAKLVRDEINKIQSQQDARARSALRDRE